jgi:hypothetical protein
MLKMVDRLASKGWLELTGSLTGMAVATVTALFDAYKSASYDPALCATSGGIYCEKPLLPSRLILSSSPSVTWYSSLSSSL